MRTIQPISMVISTHERGALLRKSMSVFASVDSPPLTPPGQIIIVDDGSESADVFDVANEIKSWGITCDYIYCDNPGWTNPCHARNVGINLAVFSEILICEPEVMFLTDVVKQIRQARTRFPDEVLYGTTFHSNDETSSLANATKMEAFPYYLLVRAAWLHAVGGYDEGLPGPWGWDDMDLYTRLRWMGHDTRHIARIEAHHQWHPSRIEPAAENEAYVRAKKYPRDLVANRGELWGRPSSST